MVDGYPLVFIDKAIRHKIFNDYIYEPANAGEHPLPAGANPAEHTPEAVVDRIAASGAICVKIAWKMASATQRLADHERGDAAAHARGHARSTACSSPCMRMRSTCSASRSTAMSTSSCTASGTGTS